MLSKKIKISLLTSVLLAGVSFSVFAKAEEKQIKPNIHALTNNDQIEIPKAAPEPRVPNDIHKHSLGIGIGQTFLRSDLGNNGDDKITPEIYYNYSASYSFDFVANLHWSKHEYQNRNSRIEGLALAIKGKGFQYDAFSPFVLGGFGFYLPSATRVLNGTGSTPVTTRDQLVFGVNAGIGCELRLNSVATVGVIAHYHDPFDVRQEAGSPLQASYLKLLITALYTFN
jgi:hypothetical protein